MCAQLFYYKHILSPFFWNIMLTHKPEDSIEYFNLCLRHIKENNLFNGASVDLSQMIRRNLNLFMIENDCFVTP